MPPAALMKAECLILLSFLLTFAVITNAFYIKKQFYPSVVYLTKSSTSLAVLYVQAFVFVVLFGKLFQKIFLGQLRAIETEHLYDRAWFSITETCLAFTVFRDDFSPRFVAMFAVLLFLKCFHWLLEDRVDFMEQSPAIGPKFHARVISLLCILSFFDYMFISSAYTHTLAKGASVQIVFGFEYAILFVTVFSTTIKYILHSIEIFIGEQWENKGVCMLYSDLILGFIRLTIYLIFIIVMMKIHTFPLFAIRPMFMAMRAFRKSCSDVLESRRAIRYLNTMYPDLTVDELANIADRTCIICRAEMEAGQGVKRLSCTHAFHKNCLRSWLQRQQTCPICRAAVLPSAATRMPPAAQQAPPAPPNQPQPAASAQAQMPMPSSRLNSSPPPSSVSSSSTSTPSTNANSTPLLNTTHSDSASPLNANTARTDLISQITFNSIPMVLPPFAFPPPPMPPANFSGMSEEAIRAMEGTELIHVQARIQCLRNVRTLLDASMIQLQQYMNIVLTQSHTENGSRLLSGLQNDLNGILLASERPNAKENLDVLNPIDENDADNIRRRRVQHYATKFGTSSPPPPSTTANQDNNNNNNEN